RRVARLCSLLFFEVSLFHRDLHSFPTRRSSDLATGGYYEHGQGNLGGTPWEYRERYLANSPIYQFDQIETPLLIGQGNKDGNLIASDAIFAALKRLGKDAEYRIYKDEGHVLESKPNVNDFWQRRLEFLAEHLNLA